MKFSLFAIMLLAAVPQARAVTVTNLDTQEHMVVFENTPGSKVTKRVKPGEVISVMQPGGTVQLHGSEMKLRVDPLDGLVIWTGGKLEIQTRRKDTSSSF